MQIIRPLLTAALFAASITGHAGNITTDDMVRDADTSYKKADKELNRLYQNRLNEMPASFRPKFTKAQRAWIKFRDLDCDFQFYPSDKVMAGTFARVSIIGCYEKYTLDRITYLKGLNQCEEGDLSCTRWSGDNE